MCLFIHTNVMPLMSLGNGTMQVMMLVRLILMVVFRVKRGARIVKWIPSIQGIDPSNGLFSSPLFSYQKLHVMLIFITEKCDNFYKEMAKSGVILHSGGERVVIDPPGINLSLDNPLLLRRPLSFGVKVKFIYQFIFISILNFCPQVIVSHCATEGKSLDIEIPPHTIVDNMQLFFRMMEDPKYPVYFLFLYTYLTALKIQRSSFW